MGRMRFFAATADPTALDRALAYPADGPVAALTAERIREEIDANQFRPEWIWLAEDEDGYILARALWWGRADSERPIALDCLQVRSTVADPAALATGLLDAGHATFGTRPLYNVSLPGDWRARSELAQAVAWRRESGARAGLSREIERLRYEWTPAAGLQRRLSRSRTRATWAGPDRRDPRRDHSLPCGRRRRAHHRDDGHHERPYGGSIRARGLRGGRDPYGPGGSRAGMTRRTGLVCPGGGAGGRATEGPTRAGTWVPIAARP